MNSQSAFECETGFSPRYHSPNEVERMPTACSRSLGSAVGAPTGLDRLVPHSFAKNCVATAVTAVLASSCAELPGVLKGRCNAGAGQVVGLKNKFKQHERLLCSPAPTPTHGGITCDSQHTIVNLLHVIAYPCLVMHFALHSGHHPDHAAAVNPKGPTNTISTASSHGRSRAAGFHA